MDLKAILIEDEAFKKLVNQVVHELKADFNKVPDKWIDTEEAMHLLRISSKTTLQKLRDEGQIRFTKPLPKHILYDRESLLDYLERHAKDTYY